MDAELLDARLRVVRSIALPGVPSRARLSPSGRWGGVTAFIVGHAYAAPGTFSTAATVIDMASGRVQGDLEKDYTVTHDGRVVDARDRNYWGLTFAPDDDTFYATLATGHRTWLIKGSIRARRAHTIHANVECPALSPDGTRIAYTKAIAHDPTVWRFTVLDLHTGRETPLAEQRSIDDQPAWLDDGHVLYSTGEQILSVPADGSGRPALWMRGADSPTVRPTGNQTNLTHAASVQR
jgi:Tol biopolymer transport system component